jgi:hypothetical protein
VRRPLLALALIGLSGCCAGADLAVSAYDPRAELQAQTTFALLAPVLEEQPVWAYASAAEVASNLAAHYRPLPDASLQVGAPTEAPARLRAALQAADQALRELGYSPTREDRADFVLSLGITTGDDDALVRVSLDVGRTLDGRFRPDLISLAAVVTPDDACPSSAAELTRDLIAALPPHEPADE